MGRHGFLFLAQFFHKLCEKFRSGVCAVKLQHPPHILHGKAGRSRKCRLEILGHQLNDRFAPAQHLLFVDDPAPDIPVKHDQFVIDLPCRRNAGIRDARLECFDELPVIGIARQVGIRRYFHLASPSSIFSASFSSRQNSASKSFAGVGGW
ncbi:MAG: hypothetical protein AW09_003350 [Candidatus Accumulibacter phosphatis]|uniref:Uncharacterized protein n=1 Tax=Candidatus Accumulibacter phosphatis TaxID=327160 RepID=A0A080M2U6_9PROT|nr:MAG: hypothetical protein AW09_003350 [Candidatus Accumulibacter phosphatis]